MAKRFLLFITLLAFIGISVSASDKDSTFRKTGFNFAVLPSISYDADFGIQYGGLANLYWYGDGSNYPKYNHSLYIDMSRYVVGSYIMRLYYDAPDLIGNVRLTADATIMHELTCDFFGFNGRESKFFHSFEDKESSNYITKFYYKYDQKMTRGMVNFCGEFGGDNPFNWQAGVTLLDLEVQSVNRNKIDKKAPDVPSLYDKYVGWGIIDKDETNGGFNTQFNLGLGYDTRDREAGPTKGIWAEVMLLANPSFGSSDGDDYGKLTIYHRQYFNLYRKKLILAYRLGLQHKLWGSTPFYLLQNWNTSVYTGATNTGLGGNKTLRGIRRNRIVADGECYGNLELRWSFWDFILFNQHFSVGTNIFADAGIVTQKYKYSIEYVPEESLKEEFDFGGDEPHISAGLGLKISYNRNFVMSLDYGKAMHEQDGSSGFYFGLNYLF